MAQADLQGDEVAHRKFKLISEDVQGKHVLTNFHGMSLTSDKIKSLVKKWQVSLLRTHSQWACVSHACIPTQTLKTHCVFVHIHILAHICTHMYIYAHRYVLYMHTLVSI